MSKCSLFLTNYEDMNIVTFIRKAIEATVIAFDVFFIVNLIRTDDKEEIKLKQIVINKLKKTENDFQLIVFFK